LDGGKESVRTPPNKKTKRGEPKKKIQRERCKEKSRHLFHIFQIQTVSTRTYMVLVDAKKKPERNGEKEQLKQETAAPFPTEPLD